MQGEVSLLKLIDLFPHLASLLATELTLLNSHALQVTHDVSIASHINEFANGSNLMQT